MNKLLYAIKSKTTFVILLAGIFLLPQTAKAQYTINSVHANLTDCDTMTRGMFIIWWDKDFDYSAEANLMLDTMLAFRNTCLDDLGMQDPLSAQDGYFCNIYVYTPGNPLDFFAVNFPEWGNGVGGDVNGYPFMTLPNWITTNWENLAHETFHIFQTHGMWDLTPGIYNTSDGGWFVETTASWFSVNRFPTSPTAFLGAEILVRTPHVPIWLGWINFPDYYSNNWQRQVHQYALSAYLYYLTGVVGVTDSNLVSVFYSGTSITPQEYLFNQLGGAALRNTFIDYAAHITNNFDFLLPAQIAAAENEWNTYAEAADDNEFIAVYSNSGSGGWVQPVDELTTNAWSFNTYKLLNTITETYTFEINGDVTGDYGDDAYFQGKVVVQNSIAGTSFYDLDMSSDVAGSLTLNLTPNDTAVYFIIASMPELFVDNHETFQLFQYQMRISTGLTGIADYALSATPKYEVARYNVLGQQIDKNTDGLQFILYSDGSSKKCFIQQ